MDEGQGKRMKDAETRGRRGAVTRADVPALETLTDAIKALSDGRVAKGRRLIEAVLAAMIASDYHHGDQEDGTGAGDRERLADEVGQTLVALTNNIATLISDPCNCPACALLQAAVGRGH